MLLGLDPATAETFFKVFYDNMAAAKDELKNTLSVNTTDSLSSAPAKGQEAHDDFGVSSFMTVLYGDG